MTRGPRYPKEEFARRGDAIYDRLKPVIEAEEKGKFILIDIETGEYEIDADEDRASDRLYARLPAAQPWGRLIGSKYLRHFGGRRREFFP